MAESNTFTGNIASVRTTYQTLTSADAFSKGIQWACFTKSPFMRAIGVEAFGVDALTDINKFGTATPTGRLIRYDSGHYGMRGPIFATGPTSFHVGRLGNFTPQLVEGGAEWSYSWHQLVVSEFIPDVDVMDNSAGLIDIKAQKMEGMKQAFVRDINLCILGNASAPDANVMGPSAVQTDLPHMISVTNNATITTGGISKANAYWQNARKAVTSIGGGGEMDRPLVLRRAMLDAKNDLLQNAEATDDYLIVCSQGAYQYYDRLMYADSVQGRNGGAMGTLAKYDSAGIQHFVFDGSPMVWDPAVTVPAGATAGTESFNFIHIPTWGLGIKSDMNFKVTDWEAPRAHDVQQTLVSHIRLRYTPFATAMRTHLTVHNIPANTD